MLSTASVLDVLGNPQKHQLNAGVWFAINRPNGFASIDDVYTLHCRLGLSKQEYDERLNELGLHGQRESVWNKKLREISPTLIVYSTSARFSDVTVRFIAFGSEPSLPPKGQMERRATTLGLTTVSESVATIARLQKYAGRPSETPSRAEANAGAGSSSTQPVATVNLGAESTAGVTSADMETANRTQSCTQSQTPYRCVYACSECSARLVQCNKPRR